ncbi:4-alpha-glucanotransferase DPE2 isoform X2 [Eutrema salsugineum]|uniref:4-alpha-glucanotransferase DPE2 isoform X2 n=1 Tax=Eutrema salsugineum TaxID=72664 RepID=UPI000CECF6D4|nr:4-alpha-glucanotransferase DPE2 isoform X2 [Eutrema salsugineum]
MMNLGSLSLSTNKSSKPMVNLSFSIPYFTHWGQSLLVCGSAPGLGSGNVKKGLLLKPSQQEDQLIWSGCVSVPPGFSCDYCYYVVDDLKNVLRSEFGMKRKLLVPETFTGGESVQLRDLWQSADQSLPFRSAFKDVIFRNTREVEIERPLGVFENKSDQDDSVVVQFKICCSDVREGTSVYVLGTPAKLGKWKVENGFRLNYVGDSMWEADCLIPKADFPIKYRYCKVQKDSNIGFESGGNRELTLHSSGSKQEYIVMSDGLFRDMPWRGAGVAVPMFSVRSEDDVGVGEFLDLKLLVDWAVDSGLHLVQLLPVNDTSVHKMWWDSYPYSSLSVFALHPLYLRVQALSERLPESIKEEIQKAKKQLDNKDVDYEATMETKLSIAKKIYDLEKDQTLNSSSFQKFFSENEGWLKPYAAFCFLRDFFETSDHSQWGTFSDYTENKLEKLASKDSLHYNTICFHYYIQYHLHVQLSEASEYARKRGVVLKGDLPIGVDRNSVDTWVNKNLFRMNTATGAPPDYFDKNGQNWGFPTYNWEEMSKDNYAWWRARLTQMGKYFTAYRIDHILGFFRIWELPAHAVTGLVGKFRPSIPLSQEELEKEGIWDFDRLSKPYVQRKFLEEKFGDFWPFIASNFLSETQKDLYEFKEDCNTEKKIAAKLKSLAEKSLLLENEDKVRRDVFDILRNVVLIKDPEDARKFYPRFNLEDTSSFQDLDDHSKNVLKRLYYDYYFQRQEDLWRKNALKTLPALLNSSNMLACGEDLGLIPSCVHPVMQELALVGLRIQRMPSESDVEFGIPSNYDYMTVRFSFIISLSFSLIVSFHSFPEELVIGKRFTALLKTTFFVYQVCAPSCHDCSTLRAWWEEDEERRQRYFKEVIAVDEIPPSQCVPEITHFILRQHVEAPSMWAIFPLQDMLALKEEYTTRPATEETINDPTNPKHYWRYRVHVTLDALMKDTDLKSTIKNLVSSSGRSFPVSAAGEDANNKKQ